MIIKIPLPGFPDMEMSDMKKPEHSNNYTNNYNNNPEINSMKNFLEENQIIVGAIIIAISIIIAGITLSNAIIIKNF